MSFLDASDSRPVHLVGIAGAGMSALAELLVRRGIPVTGCDANPSATDDLEQLGISVQPHDPSHAAGARALIVTSAMPKGHPELERARALGIPVIRRAEALGAVTRGHELVAIAGTHGKTTTTVMTAEALAAAGRRPTALVGGRVGAWHGNLLAGDDRLYVVEADEYDRSFLALSPTVAVVTNVEADHLDIYRDLAEIRAAFAEFIAGARAIVLCADDVGASTLPTPPTAEVVRYGIEGLENARSRDARLLARRVRLRQGGSEFDLAFDDESLGPISLSVPGRHNVLNALAALAAGLVLGAPVQLMAQGLAAFAGVERRFQRIGDAYGVAVLDDYAHHPTEIAATLAAARAAFPGRRVIAAFQPHLFSRTRDFALEFGRVLADADMVFLTDIYPAREQPIPGVSSALVARAIEATNGRLAWEGPRTLLAEALATEARPGDVVLTMGAGDITKTATELLQRLNQREIA